MTARFDALDRDLWLADCIHRQTGRIEPILFEGTTTAEERRERLRQAIKSNQLEMVLVVDPRGPKPKAETYREFFERSYGEKL